MSGAPVTFSDILEVTAANAGLPVAALTGRSRRPAVAHPRQRAILLARRLRPDLSTTWLGQKLGGRDHSTIHHNHKVAEQRLRDDPAEAAAVQALLAELGIPELPPLRFTLFCRDLDREIAATRRRLEMLVALKAEREART